ncbi:MAG: 2-amino-4-hydroxy-6-hydroxymethyldihydropteridine diphosphokinase [Georgenia sp.]
MNAAASDTPDQIRLVGLRAFGHHGVFAHERVDGQEFVADVAVHLGLRAAAAADDLAATVSYADVAADVVALLAGEPVDLLETLAERIADVILARPAVRAVDVTVHKPQAPITVPFDDVQVRIRRSAGDARGGAAGTRDGTAGTTTDGTAAADLGRRPEHPQRAILALGANLGEAVATLRAAVGSLARAEGLRVTGVSPLARTAPVLAPGQDPQPDYLNAVVVATTTLAPLELLALAHRIEAEHGRRRDERWGARTLDVDLVAVGDAVAATPELTLPHPRAHERAFVLLPWARTDPAAVLPGPEGGLVAALAAGAADRATVRWTVADWLTAAVPGEESGTGAVPAPGAPGPAADRTGAPGPAADGTGRP